MALVALCIRENRIVRIELQNHNKGCLILSRDSIPTLGVKSYTQCFLCFSGMGPKVPHFLEDSKLQKLFPENELGSSLPYLTNIRLFEFS